MQDHPVLGQLAIGYSPLVDRQRAVVATRLTIYPPTTGATPNAAALLAALNEVWPTPEAPAAADPKAATQRPLDGKAPTQPVSLNIAGEALLQDVMKAAPPPHLMIEVPAFMAGEPGHAGALRELRAAGSVLLIKGRPLQPLPPDVLACFSHSIVEVSEDRRGTTAPPPGVRQVSTVQAGARSGADIEAAFQRGAVAVLGWPLDDPLPKGSSTQKVPADIQVVMELINGVDRGEPVPRLEAVLKRDPTLAFRLLRYLNSPGFGLSAEVTSFGHAIMMLGYARLKRWLVLLLASSSKGVLAKPLMHAALRRGLLLEELGRGQGDAEMRGEMFICGVFSLLDRMLQQPLATLLKSVPVPERVQQTLLTEAGPYTPYLDLAKAIEQEAVFDIREGTERLLLGAAEVNRAIFAALRGARQLDG